MRVLVSDIQRATAGHFGISVAELLSPVREKRLALPRHVAMYIARKRTMRSLPELGKLFRRDHSTVMHGIEKIRTQLRKDAELAMDVKAIRRSLRK